MVKLSTHESVKVKREVLSALDCKKFEFSAEKHLEIYKQIAHNCLNLEHIYQEFELVLHTIFNCDPIWIIKFFEERIAYKENGNSQSSSVSDQSSSFSEYDAVPHRPHYLFSGVDWNNKNVVEALKRVRNWVIISTESPQNIMNEEAEAQTEAEPSSYSNALRFEARRLLVSIVGGDKLPSDEIMINSTMKTLFDEWVDSEKLELMREVAYLMKYFNVDEVFYSLAEKLLIKSGGDRQIKGEIAAALSSEFFEKRIEDLEAWRDRTQSHDVSKFADSCIDMIRQEMKRESQKDEEFLDDEGY